MSFGAAVVAAICPAVDIAYAAAVYTAIAPADERADDPAIDAAERGAV